MSRILTIISILLFSVVINIANIYAEKSNKLQFATIKFNEVNAKTGPEQDCPIEWVFIKKGEPVEIIAQYDQWRNVRDIQGEGGWIHISSLSKKRSVIIVAKNIIPLLESIERYDQIIAKLSPQLRCSLHKCKKDWCQITCKSYKGWIGKKFLWGIYPDE